VSTERYTVQLQSSRSYTRQSLDLLWVRMELETLDISRVAYDTKDDRMA
jgi:hypothetical protein